MTSVFGKKTALPAPIRGGLTDAGYARYEALLIAQERNDGMCAARVVAADAERNGHAGVPKVGTPVRLWAKYGKGPVYLITMWFLILNTVWILGSFIEFGMKGVEERV